jgi:non-lysosomal glucosylceramidase
MKRRRYRAERIGGAIAVRVYCTIRPGKTKQSSFILAWDFPISEFAQDVTYYFKLHAGRFLW